MHWLSTWSPSVLLFPGSWYSIFLTPPLSSWHFCALLQDQHHRKCSCKLPSFYIGNKQSISSVFKALTQVVEALDSAPFLVWEVSGPSLSVGTDFTIRLIPGKGFCWNNSISVRDEECDQRDREVPWEIADMGSSSFKDFILRLPVKKLLKKYNWLTWKELNPGLPPICQVSPLLWSAAPTERTKIFWCHMHSLLELSLHLGYGLKSLQEAQLVGNTISLGDKCFWQEKLLVPTFRKEQLFVKPKWADVSFDGAECGISVAERGRTLNIHLSSACWLLWIAVWDACFSLDTAKRI